MVGIDAAAVFSRTLTFRTQDLGTDATLMLMFDDKTHGMYRDKFPVCWKVLRFAAAGPYHMTVTYQSQIAFCKPQVDYAADTIVDAGAFVNINVGQKTTYMKINGVYKFTDAEADAGSHTMTAHNGTASRQNMGVGFLNHGDSAPTPVLILNDIPLGSPAQANFTPVLHAYVTSEYKETQIIRGEVSTPVIWEKNLATLDNTTTWDLKFDATSGLFTITQA